MTPINLNEVEATLRKLNQKGFCSHPRQSGNECSYKVTDAHTVQRRGGLSAIAEDGHVLTVGSPIFQMSKHRGSSPLRRIGVGNASIFPGFCNKHDVQLFKSIETKDVVLDAQSSLRFAYRAITFERFRKLAAFKFSDTLMQCDRGKPLEAQAEIQQGIQYYKSGMKVALRDMETWKARYDDCILSGRLEGFRYWFVRFDRLLPIAGCTAFYPEIDFNGVKLQDLGELNRLLEHIALNITSYDGQTVGCFGWFGSDDGPSARLVNSLKALPTTRIADAFVRIVFEHSENIFLRPSWWEGLDHHKQEVLQSHMRSGVLFLAKESGNIADKGVEYVEANVVETSSG